MRENEDKKDSFQSETHFRIASTALENLDYILKSLLQEINGPSLPDEVCVVFGATPVSCKEVYRLIMPTMCHKPQCHSTHIANDQKIQRSVFRTLVTSETLSRMFFSLLPPTNLYMFIKKKNIETQDIVNGDNFILTNGCRIPRNSRIDTLPKDSAEDFSEIESTEEIKWYQSTYVMKGFKDCVVNGTSVTTSWQES
ncbi:hypothetical protein evm_007900 [Chilo suppressalis]|nr:hypothetical protein evm_007900 [Chilo suppressalis]